MATAVGELTPEEQRAFFSGVVKMIRALQERGQVPVGGLCVTCTSFRPHVRSGPSPHDCALVGAPLAPEQLRVDCPEHVLAPHEARVAAWARLYPPEPQNPPARGDPPP